MRSFIALCTLFYTGTSLFIDKGTYDWYNWLPRVPQLARASKNGDKVSVWSALKTNSWMEFVNWEQHPLGIHAYDGTACSLAWGQDGNYSGHVTEEFLRWSVPSSWALRWTAADVIALNANLRGNHSGYENAPLVHRCFSHPEEKLACSALSHDLKDPMLPWARNWAQRRHELGRILREYYDQVDVLKSKSSEDSTVHLIFPPLARLFAKLAMLHPFPDANSRTRLVILQTELVRNGGHPVMIRRIDTPIYYAKSVFDVKDYILEGWCAWEWAFKTGKSPRLAVFNSRGDKFVDSHLKCREPDGVLQGASATPQMYVLPDKPPAPSISSDELERLRAEFGE